MVKLIKPQGYCEGVKRAIQMVDSLIYKNTKKPIYLLGKLIHNDIVMSYYKEKGIIILDEHNKIEEIKKIDSGTIILQAHGSADIIYDIIKSKKDLVLIDATCPFVLLIKNRIKEYLNKNYKVIYIGKHRHSESDAIRAISKDIIFITKLEELKDTNINPDLIYVTNQTTLSLIELEDIFNYIKNKYPTAVIDNKICLATTKRQQAVINANYDLIIVVGDINSSNTVRLHELAKRKTNSILVSNLSELKEYDIDKNLNIGIASGASTPPEIVKEIYDYLIK